MLKLDSFERTAAGASRRMAGRGGHEGGSDAPIAGA
jgi:hypothetical protein